MPSYFQQLAGLARSSHDHYFGESVVLSQPGAAEVTVDAVLGKVKTVTRTDERGRRDRVAIRTCRFLSVTTLDHRSTITDPDGTLWSVDEFHARVGSGLSVQLIRVARTENSRPDYRGRPQ